MAWATTRIEGWKIEEVRKYLERAFTEQRIDDYPKGAHAAYLFQVIDKSSLDRREVLHQLLVNRSFFECHPDRSGLRGALKSAEVASRLEQAGSRTIELY